MLSIFIIESFPSLLNISLFKTSNRIEDASGGVNGRKCQVVTASPKPSHRCITDYFFWTAGPKKCYIQKRIWPSRPARRPKMLSQRRILPFLPFKKCYFWINVSGSFPGPVYIHQQTQASTQPIFEGGGPYMYLFNHVHTYHYFCHKTLQSLHLPFRCLNIGDHLNSLIACYNDWSVNL